MKEQIQRGFQYAVGIVLILGLLSLIINAIAAVFGSLGGSSERQIAVHLSWPAGWITFVLLASLFGVVYWFKAAPGFDEIKDDLGKALAALGVLWMASRMLSSGKSMAYGPLDGLAAVGFLALLIWPLWKVRDRLFPERILPPEPPQAEAGEGGENDAQGQVQGEAPVVGPPTYGGGPMAGMMPQGPQPYPQPHYDPDEFPNPQQFPPGSAPQYPPPGP